MPESSDRSQTIPHPVRERPGLLWLLAAVVLPILLTALVVGVQADPIEDDLQARSHEALAAHGLQAAGVEFSGRDATVRAPGGTDAGQAGEIVAGVAGVRAVRTATAGGSDPGATPSGSPSTSAEPAAPFSISRFGDTIEVTGSAPNATAKAAILTAAKAAAGALTVVDRIAVDPAAKPASPTELAALVKVAASVTGDVSVNYDGQTITLTGKVADEGTRTAVEQASVAAVAGATVVNRLRVGATLPQQAGCLVAPSRITRIVTAHKFTFQPETTWLAAASRDVIEQLAAILRACPGVRLEVAGHTDSQGVPQASGPLSQRRADAVKAEFVRLGVPPERIIARGYGESQPIASNATVAGRTANRRVEIKVL